MPHVASQVRIVTAALLVLGGFFGPNCAAQDAGPSTPEIQQVIGSFLAIKQDFAGKRKWADLRRRVRLEPAIASVVDGRIHVVARVLQKLPADESIQVVRDLESLLAAALQKEAGADRPFHGRPAADWVRESTIATGPPVTVRRLSEVSEIEVISAIHDYVETLQRDEKWQAEGLGQLRRLVQVLGPELGIRQAHLKDDKLSVAWTAAAKDPTVWPAVTPAVNSAAAAVRANWQRAGNRARATLNEFNNDVWNTSTRLQQQYADLIRPLVVQALTTHIPAHSSTPLLEEIPSESIQIDLQLLIPEKLEEILHAGAQAAAMPAGAGNRQVDSTAGNSSAGYPFRFVTFKDLQRLSTENQPVLTQVPLEQADVSAAVKRREFQLDLQGFAGGTLAALEFSPDGKRLAAAGDVLRIWNLETGALEQTLRAGQPTERATGFRDIAYTPDGTLLCAAMSGTKHRIWVYETGDLSRPKFALAGHDVEVDHLAFSPDGRHLATADLEGNVFLWDWAKHRKLWGVKFNHSISHLSVSQYEVFAIDKMRKFSRIPFELETPGGWFGDDDPLITLINNSTFPGEQPDPGEKPLLFPRGVAVSQDSQILLIGGRSGRDGQKDNYHWCAAFSTEKAVRDEPQYSRQVVDHRYPILGCALSLDHRLCASGDALGLIQVWDRKSGEVKHRFEPFGKGNLSVDFGESLDHWQLGRDRYVGEQWKYNHWAPLHLQFDFGKRILSSVAASEPRDAKIRDPQRLSYDYKANLLQLFEDDRLQASIDFSSSTNWKLFGYGFHPVHGLDAGYGVIVCSEDGGVLCLDPKTLRPKRTFIGHKSRVWSAAVSRDSMNGKRLITTGSDGIIHVWSLEHFKPTYNLAALVDENLTITYLYPGTSTAERLAVGDRIVSIDGRTPIEWLDSEQAAKASDDPVIVVVERNMRRYRVPVVLSEMGDLARPIVSAVLSEDGGEWAIWTRSGYFDCSPQASRLIGWVESREGDQPAPFIDGGQLRTLMHRPDVVNLTLTLGDDQLALRQANALRNPGAPPPPANVPNANNAPLPLASTIPSPPRVRFLQPLEGSATATAAETVEVRVVVTAPVGRRPEIVFRVNESVASSRSLVVEGVAPSLPPPPAGYEHYFAAQTISLRVGSNLIQATARLPEVQTAEGTSFVIVERRLDAMDGAASKPTLHWCSIGINDYEGSGLKSLQFAKNDVDKVAEALAKRQARPRFPYGEVKVHRLVDQQANKTGIGDLFDALISPTSALRVRTGDTVGIHISAHGGKDPGSEGFMLVAHGSDPHKPTTCILWTDFVRLAYALGQKNVRLLLFVDTCRAGGLGDVEVGPARIFSSEFGGLGFTASGAKQSALESTTWEHGAFSLALREALEGKQLSDVEWVDGLRPDQDKNDVVEASELDLFLRRRVQSLTKDQQVPPIYLCPRMGINPVLF